MALDAELAAQIARAHKDLGTLRAVASHLGISPSTVHRYLHATPAEDHAHIRDETRGDDRTVTAKGHIATLDELLAAANVDTERWTVCEWSANAWSMPSRHSPTPIQMHQVKARLKPRLPVLDLAVRFPEAVPRRADHIERPLCFILPDSQNGYRLDLRRMELDPFHDRAAWDCAIQALGRIADDVDTVHVCGDMLDLPCMSRYLTDPATRHLVQPTVDELHWWLARVREAAPHARIVWTAGNHDERMLKKVMEQLGSLVGVRPADDPNGHPLVSIERLCATDALGIEYVGPYPSVASWRGAGLMHGHLVRPRGRTVGATLDDCGHSISIGHIHRREVAHRTLWDPDGTRRTHAGVSAGTIARVDPGIVPAFKPRNDWQQGWGTLRDHGQGSFSGEAVAIEDGVTYCRGERLTARDRSAEIRRVLHPG